MDAFLLHGRKAIQMKTVCGNFQAAVRHVHSKNVGEFTMVKQFTQQAAFSTAKIKNALCARGFQCGDYCPEALLPEFERFFNSQLFMGMGLLSVVWIELVFFCKP